jgi:FtsP/CotA-like multicopper oxidase with cupredoxin domain
MEMSDFVQSALTRRSFMLGASGLAATVTLPYATYGAKSPAELNLTAAPARWPLVGKPHPATDVWAYETRIPGPAIRLQQGEPVRITIKNELPEDTTVHWHGIRLPNAMDGVPGLTQAPIKPGESFTYEFTPPDAGTFWYHPHADSLQQIGRGLAGALIVDAAHSPVVDRDILWVLTDWRLTSEAQIARGFGNAMEAAMSGRVGNTVTINGEILDEVRVQAGERIRLRLINTSLARMMALRFEGHHPFVVAIDGQPCDPHEPKGGRVLLGPAMRVDLVIDMQGEPQTNYRVVDDFYDGLSYWLTKLVYDDKAPLRAHPLDAPIALPPNPLPEPDLSSAERHELTLQGGMMGGGAMMGTGGMRGLPRGASWAINGVSTICGDRGGMPPLLILPRGRTYLLAIRNETAWWHPMHLHGFSFRVLSRNGAPVPHKEWADTVLVPPKETAEVAFVADNPGDWMFHCHVTDHQVSGMMTVLRVA